MAGSINVPDLWASFQAVGPAEGTVPFWKTNPSRFWGLLAGFLEQATLAGIDSSNLDSDFYDTLALADGSNLDEDFTDTLAPAHEYDVTRYGAVLNDTADDRVAIQAAIDAAEAAGGGLVRVPGKSRVSATLTVNSDGVRIVGDGFGRSHLKFTDDSAETGPLVEFTHATQLNNWGITDIVLDGNKTNVTGSEGGLYVQNAQYGTVINVWIQNSSGYGIYTNTTSTGTVTTQESNHYIGVRTRANDGNGQHYQGEKNTQWSMLWSDLDAADGTDGTGGIVFEGMEDATDNRETTECTVNGLFISGSGRFGLILDGITKYAITGAMIHNSDDSGVFLRNTNTDGTTNAGPIALNTLTGFVLRNNATDGTMLGWAGIETDANDTLVNSLDIASWIVDGSNQANAGPGVFDVSGWQSFRFTSVEVRSCKGTVWNVGAGENTDGTTVQSSRGVWSGCLARGNGNAAASANHGINFADLSQNMTVIGSTFDNNVTGDGTSYEINIGASCTLLKFANCDFTANTVAGEMAIAAGAEDEVRISGCTWRGDDSFVPTVAAAATLILPPEAYNGACTVTGTTNITAWTNLPSGTHASLVFTDATPGDIEHGNNIVLTGDTNFSPTTGDAIRLIQLGTSVYQT